MTDSELLCDVAIIGAGPAGSVLAYYLGREGFRIILIDKDKFPRNQVCAGSLPVKIAKIIPFDIGSIVEKTISEVTLTHSLENGYWRFSPKPLLYTVSREKLDYFMVQKAISAGVVFSEGRKIDKLSLEGDAWAARIDDKIVKASVLVGADGVNSVVAKKLFLTPSNHFHMGLQYEVPIQILKNPKYPELLDRGIILDWGSFEDSYAWIVPKNETASVGIQGPNEIGKELKEYLDNFLRHYGVSPKNLTIMGHLMPHRTEENPISAERALLIGDAAGLVNFWTGQGIFYAIKSARFAAVIIRAFLKGELTSLDGYEFAVNQEITPEIRASYQFSRIFNRLSGTAFKLIKKYDYPWDVFCQVMRGDKTFSDLLKRFRPDIFHR
jgi:geranylgeranyl reductase family protein